MDAPPFVIKELTGDEREVRLVGRALPHRPFTLKGDQRVELTWLPGSPEATATVLGPTEGPTQLAGAWKTKYLDVLFDRTVEPPFTVDGAMVTTVKDACAVMDSIRRRGQLLQVTWLDVVRRGFLASFERRYHNEHDVDWTMDFQWLGQGDEVAPAVFVTDRQLSDVSGALQRQMAALDDVGTPDAFGLLDDFVDGFRAVQAGIEGGVLSVVQTAQHLADRVVTPVRAARGAIASLQGVADAARDLMAHLDGQAAGALNAQRPPEEQRYAEVLEAVAYRRALRDWALALRRQALEDRDALVRRIEGDVLRVHVVREGEDLRSVSRLAYGTPFEWRRLLVFNELPSVELDVGQVVLVPRLNPEEAGQESPGV